MNPIVSFALLPYDEPALRRAYDLMRLFDPDLSASFGEFIGLVRHLQTAQSLRTADSWFPVYRVRSEDGRLSHVQLHRRVRLFIFMLCLPSVLAVQKRTAVFRIGSGAGPPTARCNDPCDIVFPM